MTPEEIIREAILYTELHIEQRSKRTMSIKEYRKHRREFPLKLLAILKDEVY